MRAVIVCAAICVTAFLVSCGASPARAAAAPPDSAASPASAATAKVATPSAHAHSGFYLRWTTGLGTAGAKTDLDNGPGQPKTRFELSGLSGEGDIAIGSAPFKSLPIAFHLTAWGWRVNDPDIEGESDHVDGALSAGGVGPGATWFLPYNAYLSVAGGVGKFNLKLHGDKTKYQTKSGTAWDAVLGKEWWVSPSWGIGLAGGMNYFSAKDPKKDGLGGSQSKWSDVSYSLRLSATYN